MSYAEDPYRFTVLYPISCRCGKVLKKGDDAVYYPREGKITCTDCGDPDIQACHVEDGTSYFP